MGEINVYNIPPFFSAATLNRASAFEKSKDRWSSHSLCCILLVGDNTDGTQFCH